ncbi:MAG: type I-C CRISPR-associated protein Cas8c/Csd1, partial [Lentisphaerae bacterium]|nr:type I-C CRISPR-associated protein Cas8c/Csd1 [Lentisphaerota bacterium]
GNALKGRCLVTGEFASLSRLAGATPILGSKSNASLIGFQKNSGYDSYGKEQGYNAPIAQTTEFALTTALKSLLSKDSNHCMLIGGLTLLFWTAEDKPVLTGMFQQLIGSHQKKEENLQDLRALYDSVFTGKMPKGELENRFYLLGMAPNSARISVVLWKNGNVKQLGLAIEQHLRDFEISCADKDKHLASPSAYAVFRALAFENKLDGLPDNFKSAFLQAVFQGSQYPNALLSQAITRIRADRKFLILRLAGIKAYLNRLARVTQSKQKEISMALDVNNPSLGYQCGRLFACLEKIQSDSSKNLNADIRDRFYGAASATPVTVFGRLLALSKHHLAKLNPGTAIFYEQLCAEIVAHLNDFPAHLNLAEQGRFAIGYYHQRLDLYTAQKDKEKNSVFSDKNQQKEQADV